MATYLHNSLDYKSNLPNSNQKNIMKNCPKCSNNLPMLLTGVRFFGNSAKLKLKLFFTGSTELCTVHFTSLNFRDIMLATGKLPPDALPGNLAQQDCILGMEFSGTNQSGKRIMGLLPAQALATSVLADQRFTWEVRIAGKPWTSFIKLIPP